MNRATISIREAASTLGISLAAAYSATHSGELPVIRIGKRLLVVRAGLERMLGGAVAQQQQTGEGVS